MNPRGSHEDADSQLSLVHLKREFLILTTFLELSSSNHQQRLESILTTHSWSQLSLVLVKNDFLITSNSRTALDHMVRRESEWR